MALNYRRVSEEEDQRRGLIDKGEYTFQVAAIEQKRTSNGKYDMLAVDLIVWDITNRERKLKDWIVFAEEMDWKFRHFCKSLGLLQQYEEGSIEVQHFPGKKGKVKVGQKDGQTKDGDTRLVNFVMDYLNDSGNTASNSDTFKDDEIPF